MNLRGRQLLQYLPWLVFIVSIALTAGLTWSITQINQQYVTGQLKADVAVAASNIESRILSVEHSLRGAKGSYLTANIPVMSREAFAKYMSAREGVKEYPGLMGVGIIHKVAAKDEADFLFVTHLAIDPKFTIHPSAPIASERYVVTLIEPLAPSQSMIGLDIAADPLSAFAAQQAMRTGKPMLSAPLRWGRDVSSSTLLFLLPIFQENNEPILNGPSERQHVAWSFAAMRAADLFSAQEMPKISLAHLTITDITNPLHPTQFFSRGGEGQTLDNLHQQITKNLFGRVWRFEVDAHPAYIDANKPYDERYVLIAGLLLSIVAAVLARWVMRNQLRDREMAQIASQMAAIVTNSADAIIASDLNGRVTAWNPAAERLFGYPYEEVIGTAIASLLVPPTLLKEDLHCIGRVKGGERLSNLETLRLHRRGHEMHVSISMSPITDHLGRIIGISSMIRDIAEQKAAEEKIHHLNENLELEVARRTEALNKTSRSLKTIMDSMPSMIGYWDANEVNLVANLAYHEWYGIPLGQMPGMTVKEVLGDELYEVSRPFVQTVLTSGEEQRFERKATARDGSIHTFFVNYIPEVQADKVIGFHVITHDVTDLYESKEQLALALQQNQLLLHNINEQLLYSETDAGGLITDVNEKFCLVHGYEKEELLGKSHRILQSGQQPPAFWSHFWEVLKSGNVWHGEICNLSKAGEKRWFDSVIAPIVARDGLPAKYIALRIDITKRKLAEEKIEKVNQEIRNLLNAASEVAIIAIDLTGLITVFNTGAERMLGYRPDEVIGKTTPVIFHVMDELHHASEVLSKKYGRPIEGLQIFVYEPELLKRQTSEWTFIRKDRSLLTVALTVTPARDTHGNTIGYLGIARDITNEKQQQRALARASEQLAMAADTAHLGIWSWVPGSELVQVNHECLRIYQLPDDLLDNGVLFETWRQMVHPDDLGRVEQHLEALVAGTGEFDLEFCIELPGNQLRYIKASAYVERDATGLPILVVGTNQDISEQKVFERSLLESKQLAEQASETKSRFMANVSHEIRTPMNAVLGMLQLLQQTPQTQRQADYTEKARQAAKSLLQLLNDILDFSKIEAEKLALDELPFGLDEILDELVPVLAGNLNGKPIELLFDIDPAIPARLLGDSLRLKQVILNLMGNAMKFTAQGMVSLTIQLKQQDTDAVVLRFAIQDSGIGISKANQQRIFEGFTQAEASTTRRFGGTGLGLAISQHLVHLMRGEIAIESEPGQGSLFWFELSLPYTDGQSPIWEVPGIHAIQPVPKVLIVDDNPVTRLMISRALGFLGWAVDSVADGYAAIDQYRYALAKGQPYPVILMDWYMPGIDGLEAARQIRLLAPSDRQPFVMMVTGIGQEMMRIEQEQGNTTFDAILSKPFTPVQLVKALVQGLVMPSEDESTLLEGELIQPLKGVRLLVVEDNALNRMIASELLQSAGAEVVLAENGQLGVEQLLIAGNHFDLVLMDLQMPVMDGYEATRQIRLQPKFARLPILAMTANVSVADRANCLAAGMNGHIGKPIEMNVVIRSILNLLNKPIPAAETIDAVASVPDVRTDVLVSEKAQILTRFSQNEAVFYTACRAFPAEASQLISLLTQEIASEAWAEARRAAHSLKGVSATIGAVKLSQAAKAMEVVLDEMDAESISPEIKQQWLVDRMPALSNVLSESVTVLTSYLPATESAAANPQEQWGKARSLAALSKMREQLESMNLQILDELDEIVAHLPIVGRDVMTSFVRHVKNLDFSVAQAILKQLQEELSHAEVPE